MQREFSDGKKFGGEKLARENLAERGQWGNGAVKVGRKNQGKKVSKKWVGFGKVSSKLDFDKLF